MHEDLLPGPTLPGVAASSIRGPQSSKHPEVVPCFWLFPILREDMSLMGELFLPLQDFCFLGFASLKSKIKARF